jgi:exodeoxyribonuclease VII large subunit
LRQRRDVFRQEAQRLREQFHYHLETKLNRLSALEARLRLLGPEQVLARGYSITMDARTGTVLHQASEAAPGQRLKTRLKAGEVVSRVEG